MPATREATTRYTLASRRRPSIYPIPDGFLFVPTEDQWNVREQSKPSTIATQAELGKDFFTNQVRTYGQRFPWIAEYLYAVRELPRDGSADGFETTPGMLAFRNHATIQAILGRAKRSKEQVKFTWAKGKRNHVSDALLSAWRKQFKDYEWYDRWQLRGEEPPPNVRVVTVQQSQRASRAWDFSTFCADLGFRADGTYVLWLRNGQVPDLGWLKWLYGFLPPDGAYVVSLALQRLRHEKSRKGVARAAGLNDAAVWHWEQDDRTRDIIATIVTGGKGKDAKGWDELDAATQRRMTKVVQAASLNACCERAGMSVAQYRKEFSEADRCGVKAELLAYLAS
jgi:hypothetical protein